MNHDRPLNDRRIVVLLALALHDLGMLQIAGQAAGRYRVAEGLLRRAGGGKRLVWKERRSHGLGELGECCGQAERR
jgi:hypothetical protein